MQQPQMSVCISSSQTYIPLFSYPLPPPRIDAAQSYGPLCKQEGVFRVNCMDCLDRTNVVESILSREVLQVAVSWCMSCV